MILYTCNIGIGVNSLMTPQTFNPNTAAYNLRCGVDGSRTFRILTVVILWGTGDIPLCNDIYRGDLGIFFWFSVSKSGFSTHHRPS